MYATIQKPYKNVMQLHWTILLVKHFSIIETVQLIVYKNL